MRCHQQRCRQRGAGASGAAPHRPHLPRARLSVVQAASAQPEFSQQALHEQQASVGRRQLLQGCATLLSGVATITSGWHLHPAAATAAASSTLRAPTPEEQAALTKALNSVVVKTKAPLMLRLAFHDAGTYSASQGGGGANGSIRFELDRKENFGLKRGWRVVEQLASELKGTAAASLSLADLVALSGAHAVAVCGGPKVSVRVGRVDSGAADPEGRLPGEGFSSQQQKDNFSDKGLSPREFLALSGAHTIGSKGYGDPYTFDNVYYKELLKKPWLNPNDNMASMIGLPSDHVLPDDPELNPIIQEYAKDQSAFHRDFAAAYLRLSELGA